MIFLTGLGIFLVLFAGLEILVFGWPQYCTPKAIKERQVWWRDEIEAGRQEASQACDAFRKELGCIWFFYWRDDDSERNYINVFFDASLREMDRRFAAERVAMGLPPRRA